MLTKQHIFELTTFDILNAYNHELNMLKGLESSSGTNTHRVYCVCVCIGVFKHNYCYGIAMEKMQMHTDTQAMIELLPHIRYTYTGYL